MRNAAHSSAMVFTLLPKTVALVAAVSGCGPNQSSVPVAAYAKEAGTSVSTIDAKVTLHLRDQSNQEITVRFLHAVGPEAGGTP